jgi:hypothetical protein
VSDLVDSVTFISMEAIALHACQADDPLHELSFAKGDVLLNGKLSTNNRSLNIAIHVFILVRLSPTDDGWYEATLERTGERGIVPCNYVEIISTKKVSIHDIDIIWCIYSVIIIHVVASTTSSTS